jgi:predicted ArsR family transcriptional regulator
MTTPCERAPGTRDRIQEELRTVGAPLHPAELAARLDVHVNTVRHHLEMLELAGEVTRGQLSKANGGRPRIGYALAASPSSVDRCVATSFLSRVLAAYVSGTADDAEAAGFEAGVAWGRHLIQAAPFARTSAKEGLERLVQLLRGIGFRDSHVGGPGGALHLGALPCGDVARTAPDLLAGIYLGVVTGALDAQGAPLRVTGISATKSGDYVVRFEPTGAGEPAGVAPRVSPA